MDVFPDALGNFHMSFIENQNTEGEPLHTSLVVCHFRLLLPLLQRLASAYLSNLHLQSLEFALSNVPLPRTRPPKGISYI